MLDKRRKYLKKKENIDYLYFSPAKMDSLGKVNSICHNLRSLVGNVTLKVSL